MTERHRDNRKLAADFSRMVSKVKLSTKIKPEERLDPGQRRRRRGFREEDYDGLATLSLIDDDNIPQWSYDPPARGLTLRRRRSAAAKPVGGEIIASVRFAQTPANEVIEKLSKLDDELTPKRGLRRYQPSANGGKGGFVSEKSAAYKKRILLLVHGTFSKSDMFADEFAACAKEHQDDFLGKALASKHYEAVLAFDHPTLSVSPWINALELEEQLIDVTGEIDVICHSRGGLVVGWWLRNGRRNVKNVVFVGSPLDGTSLASPGRLRQAMQGLTGTLNAIRATSLATTYEPLFATLVGVATICSGVLQFASTLPLADATVAMIPGLGGQSRAKNNAELIYLNRKKWITTPEFHAVISEFEPLETDDRWWEVWKRFGRPDKNLDNIADSIFQDANDLVVDTASMTTFCQTNIAKKNIQHFARSPTVHHCNYFRQKETVTHLYKSLKIP